MAFRIGNRVISAIGLVLFLFFITSLVSHLLTQRIKDDVYRLVGIDEGKQSASAELQAQIAELARSVVAYAYGRDATGKDPAGQWKDRLGRSASRLSKLATIGEERELVREVNALVEDFVSQGDQVIAVVDRERAEIVALRAMGRLVEANVVKRRFKTLHILDPERPKALVDAT